MEKMVLDDMGNMVMIGFQININNTHVMKIWCKT